MEENQMKMPKLEMSKIKEQTEKNIAETYSEVVEIDKDIAKEFNKAETKLLKEALGIIAFREEKFYGLSKLSGGYCHIKVDEIESDADDDTDGDFDEDFDWILFWIETGQCEESRKSSKSIYCKISRKVVNDTSLTPRQKADTYKEA
jgi:hypothetical protein